MSNREKYVPGPAGAEVQKAGEKWTLEAGDVLAFRGDQKHSYANPGAVPAVGYSAVLLVDGISGRAHPR